MDGYTDCNVCISVILFTVKKNDALTHATLHNVIKSLNTKEMFLTRSVNFCADHRFQKFDQSSEKMVLITCAVLEKQLEIIIRSSRLGTFSASEQCLDAAREFVFLAVSPRNSQAGSK